MALDDLGLALPLRALRSFPGDFGFLRRPLPQPANSQVPEYRNAYSTHPPHAAYPRNPPNFEKYQLLQMVRIAHRAGCRTTHLNAGKRPIGIVAVVFLTPTDAYARLRRGGFQSMRRMTVRAISTVPGLLGLGLKRRLRPAVLTAAGALLALGGGLFLAVQDGLEPSEELMPQPNVSDMDLGAEEFGGQSIVAKFAAARNDSALRFAAPTPVKRLLSMALAQVPSNALPPAAEPNLAGLSEIPKELIWNRPEDEEDEEDGPRASFAAFSEAQEQLPWDAVEPVPFAALAPAKTAVQSSKGHDVSASDDALPAYAAGGAIDAWLKAKVTEIKGADRSRPLYHFELWLEPPTALKRQLTGVSYAFSTPAIRPQSQASSDSGSGFRISAGGLACADKIVVTLRFTDGHVETASVDGCKLLS